MKLDTVVFDFQVICENIGHLQFEKKALSGFYDDLNVENRFQRSNGKQQARNTQQNVIRIAETPACKESKKQIIVEKFKF
ncbi:hypothetical protein T12_859 [Trichinella patagoniensis]|uniref:Uncharacterized protein n=1 Tax=Trichinella patagoniensis TaxID=990121 RepID=A0A0V0ZY94_9BILA|nr:hypothetical protein T12_859 [Trichinella patagoniensis]